jgi:hypothetical protein
MLNAILHEPPKAAPPGPPTRSPPHELEALTRAGVAAAGAHGARGVRGAADKRAHEANVQTSRLALMGRD